MREKKQSKGSPKVELHHCIQLGLIIFDDNGIVYCNQTGGKACHFPERKGFYVPLGLQAGLDLKKDWTNNFGELRPKDILIIGSILRKYRMTSSIYIDTEMLHISEEAWVFVNIRNGSNYFTDFGPYPRKGILTWQNSYTIKGD